MYDYSHNCFVSYGFRFLCIFSCYFLHLLFSRLSAKVAFMICKVNILVFYSNCDFLKVFCSLNHL